MAAVIRRPRAGRIRLGQVKDHLDTVRQARGGARRRALRLGTSPGAAPASARCGRTHENSARQGKASKDGCPGPLLAACLSAHRTMINGSALCADLAVTERD